MPRASVVVLTGAGISADSGVPTFRGAGGLWEGHRVEEVATPQAWRRDPALVWRFYQARRAKLASFEPSVAHRELARLARELGGRGVELTLVTQNVDDLHERALSQPLHMHGELAVLRCERCGSKRRDLEHVDSASFVPCSACGFERLRPDVVWFGEMPYFQDEIGAAVERATHFLAIGTSGVVHPAAGLLSIARSRGAATYVNSLEPPDNLDPSDRFSPGRAVDVVPRWVESLLREL